MRLSPSAVAKGARVVDGRDAMARFGLAGLSVRLRPGLNRLGDRIWTPPVAVGVEILRGLKFPAA
jgi:hypothetical protein